MAQSALIPNRIFDAVSIAASGVARSVPISLADYKPGGFFSLHIKDLTDDGTLDLTYELSNDVAVDIDGITYVTPSSASDIVTGFTKTSGPGSDGEDLISFTPEPARWMRLIATETTTTDVAVLTAILVIQ